MKRGDLVKMKESAAAVSAVRARPTTLAATPAALAAATTAYAAWAMRVGVIIEVIEDVEPAGDQCVVYWSDNIKSTHWETDLEMK
tara:strand:- start:185 stop:439 length:255 start_codon:yes stop_codon:yes gene_type:complete